MFRHTIRLKEITLTEKSLRKFSGFVKPDSKTYFTRSDRVNEYYGSIFECMF